MDLVQQPEKMNIDPIPVQVVQDVPDRMPSRRQLDELDRACEKSLRRRGIVSTGMNNSFFFGRCKKKIDEGK
jgi:hypothetical protein